jgi:hypothetical protein
MQLAKTPKVRYSLMEHYLFRTLPQDGQRIGSDDIVKACKRPGGWDVKFPLKNVTVTMKRLIEKVDLNKETFRVGKSEKAPGQHKIEYWLEARTPGRRRKTNGR